MNFINIPNLPQQPVRLVVIDGRSDKEIIDNLAGMGIKAIKTLKHTGVYDAISYHPDIMLHHIKDQCIVYAPGTPPDILYELSYYGFILIPGETPLSHSYPGDIAYNVARVCNMAFHNFNHTDPVLKFHLIKAGVELVHVNQGYSKCSISVVDDKSIITSDRGIAKTASEKGIDVLFTEPDPGIRLPGLNYGFIGGSTGLLDRSIWATAGSLGSLKSSHQIHNFLANRGIKAVSLSLQQITDIGTIIPLLTT